MDQAARVRPRPVWAWGIGLIYGPLMVFIESFAGVPYHALGDSAGAVIAGIVMPLFLGAVVLVGLTRFLGWWGPVLREARSAPRWVLVFPALIALVIAAGFDGPRFAALDPLFLGWMAVAALLIGFCEEVTFRGLVVVGLRGGVPEAQVWLWSSLMFAGIHLWNIGLGVAVGQAVLQFCLTFIIGTGLYVCRRATGRILVPMLLHAAWDWTAFAQTSTALADPAGAVPPESAPVFLVVYPVIVVLFAVAARGLFGKRAG